MQLLLWIALLLPAAFQPVNAHESRPLYVEINETAPDRYVVTWKIPPSASGVGSPSIVMPEGCKASAPPAGARLTKRRLFACANDLSGRAIRIEFPDYNPAISTLFRFHRLSGEKHTTIKGPNDPAWIVPQRETTASVARQYLLLGVEHILYGYDHLLFVACLMFIAGTWRRVLVTITGFTVAHSVTLALAALDLLRVPVPPVEAAIAVSIVFLAVEIVRNRRDTLTWRFPVAVASSFGLLHGFGFASVLNEIGLPQTEIPAALLFFNLGVEVGQILFVGGLAFLLRLISMLASKADTYIVQNPASWPNSIIRPTGYCVGALATFWLIERLQIFLV